MNNSNIKLRFPEINFAFKPIKPKYHRESNGIKTVTCLLYCEAIKDEEGNWKAKINTKGIKGFNNITILPFTEKSYDLSNRINVFYHTPDKQGRYTRIIRTEVEATLSPGNPQTYTPFCTNCVFTGRIIKIDNKYQFDLNDFIGTVKQNIDLLTLTNTKKNNIDNE